MKKLITLFGVLALMFVPASVASADYSADTAAPVTNQSTSEDTTFTVNVLAAIELSDPADDSDSVAPLATGLSNTADLDMSASLRSNLQWEIDSFTAGQLTGARDLLADLTGDGNAADSGSRNDTTNAGENGNDAQAVDADYNQVVSWGDEAGAYTEVITHTATQAITS